MLLRARAAADKLKEVVRSLEDEETRNYVAALLGLTPETRYVGKTKRIDIAGKAIDRTGKTGRHPRHMLPKFEQLALALYEQITTDA